MKVAVVGAGAIGLLVTYHVVKSGIDVLLLTRTKAQADLIAEHGIGCIDRSRQRDRVFVRAIATEAAFKLDDVDVVIFTVKSYQLRAALEQLRLTSQPVLFLQNGMGHVSLFDTLQVPTIAVGVVEHGALREDEMTVRHTGVGKIRWSYVRKETDPFTPLFATVSSQQFPINYEADWKEMLETKLIINACINPLTALFKVKNGMLIENEHFKQMMRALFLEVVDVLGRQDQERLWELVTAVCKNTAENRSSMLVDCEEKRKTEVDSILGYVIEKGKNRKKTPLTTFLYHGLKAIEGDS